MKETIEQNLSIKESQVSTNSEEELRALLDNLSPFPADVPDLVIALSSFGCFMLGVFFSYWLVFYVL